MQSSGSTVTFKVATRITTQPACLAVFLLEGAQGPSADERQLSDISKKALARLIRSGVSRGKARDVHFDLIDDTPRRKPEFRRVYAVGLGPVKRVSAEAIRRAAGALARAIRKHRLDEVTIALPQFQRGATDLNASAIAEAVVGGILLASFEFLEMKGTAARRDDGPPRIRSITLLCSPETTDAVKRGVERGRIVADGQNFARTIASRPGNVINPPSLAKVAQDLAKEVGLGVKILDEKQMQKLGMGGMLAVGAGSAATPPRLIVLDYAGKSAGKSAAPLLVVGKSITFDTGGISIKPADKMGRMIFDKCGGMAVLGLMYAVAKLKLPIRVIGILAAAENHISDTAYRPGDILRMYNGVTVEVTNTDAEGRLVLADSLAWGIEQYKPSAVVNLATLTGGVVVALGKTMAGIMSNDDGLVGELNAAADAAGEKLWRLPIGEDQRDYIKSDAADIVNSGGREGHPLQGGAFLSYFVPGGAGDSDRNGLVPWAHLDIAGVADTEKELPYYAKGATGWGVRTLVEWVSRKA